MAGLSDPMRFKKAEEFFNPPSSQGPKSIVSVQSSSSRDAKDPLRYAALITFDDNTTCLFQFVTTQLWRIRFDPTAKTGSDYSDANSRTIVQNSFANLVDELQIQLRRRDKPWNAPYVAPDSCWATTFEEAGDQNSWILTAVRYPSVKDAAAGTNGIARTKAYFQRDPFQIQCSRVVQPQSSTLQSTPGTSGIETIVWQTIPTDVISQSPETPRATNVVFNIAKPRPAVYLGFGEQGGRNLLKPATLMNYFCYDNYNYNKVYNKGPTEPSEPLYHSQPFFMEANGVPGSRSVTATLVDNYSQVFIDLGNKSPDRIALGVRFGIFDAYFMAADRIPELIWLFTSIVGRPRLKPRYVLGHHQGCYGYENRAQLEYVVSNYRNAQIPLDGLAIDVDFQHKYRTFTSDDQNFPNVQDMFTQLRQKGIKCCTNITPIISFDGYRTDNDSYPTINAAWDHDAHTDPAKNFLIMDKRFLDGLPTSNANDQKYLRYDGGNPQIAVPSSGDRPQFNNGPDMYDFGENFNSGWPFHGGVSYGAALGIPGFYPDLNRKVVREQFWGPQYQDLFNKGLEFVWQDMTTPAVAYCYGDMLGFPGRLMVSTDPYDQQPDVLPPQKPAIELWALYSYNLHKATYKALEVLPGRENKRNFIIGRGSSTGMHRYAGLWTGDNASSWDFWRINIAQVIALGLGGITIAGEDMGGFTQDPQNPGQWCDPDLFVRWYSGAFLLPWYRNHYDGKGGHKLFQEAYKFSRITQDYGITLPADQSDLYESVTPICRYYVQLRYSLMQALYDRMFENLINGLPIVRSMLITDPDDTRLVTDAASFLDSQYFLGHYILVCPIFDPDNTNGGARPVYFPTASKWYPFNLRVEGSSDGLGISLNSPVEGGNIINYGARISSNPEQFPYITPVYIREGAIIPQIEVRDYIGDGIVNPVTLNIYPGKNNWYSMFLDDGVSRSSAPMHLPQYENNETSDDTEAKGEYREVRIDQKSTASSRKITLSHVHDGYDPAKDVGETYRIVIWMDTAALSSSTPVPSVTFTDITGNAVTDCSYVNRPDLNATVVSVPIGLPGSGGGLVITHTPGTGAGPVVNGVAGTP